MSAVYVRELEPADAPAFLALTARCDVGTSRVGVLRGDDPFALGRYFGPTRTWGAFESDDLVATAAISTQRRFVRGEIRPLAYLHDLRVDPERRGRGLAHALADVAHHECAWAITTILDDNPLGHPLAVYVGERLGRPTELGRTAHVVLPRDGSLALDRRVEVRPISEGTFALEHTRFSLHRGYLPEPRAEGLALAAYLDGALVSVCRRVDERERRRFVMGGHELSLAYLAHLAPSRPSREILHAFAMGAEGYALAAVGLDFGYAQSLGLVPALTSRTWAFGAPNDERLEAHELTWI